MPIHLVQLTQRTSIPSLTEVKTLWNLLLENNLIARYNSVPSSIIQTSQPCQHCSWQHSETLHSLICFEEKCTWPYVLSLRLSSFPTKSSEVNDIVSSLQILFTTFLLRLPIPCQSPKGSMNSSNHNFSNCIPFCVYKITSLRQWLRDTGKHALQAPNKEN